MLEEPYRWVEAIQNRRDYLDHQLQGASPVVGLSYERGIVLLTTTPGPRKLFEVYDQLAFAAIGHPADIEKLRKAAIDMAHLEGFNFSARDVSLQRLVSFGLAPIIKAAFDEIFRSPYTARILMAELDPPGGQDAFSTVDPDGSFINTRGSAVVAGTQESSAVMRRHLMQYDGAEPALEEALKRGLEAWGAGRRPAADEEDRQPDGNEIKNFLGEALRGQQVEAAVLDRTLTTRTKFRRLKASECEEILAACSDS
jgi:proteasome alpha subunit